MRNFIKKNKIELLSFFIPIILIIIIFACNNKAPFGKYIVMMYDGSLQYPGFASLFSEFLKGSTSLLYSFKGALGFNLYAGAIYYTFNPTNLLLILFNSLNLDIFYVITVLLKIGLCGLSASLLLKYKAPNNKCNIIFACAYALTTYNLVYYYNFMWFDSIAIFPIVVLGLEKLIKENKKALYIVTLTLSIISNFYIGYMICIFCLLYFIYKYILLEKKERKFKIIKHFIISSLLSGLMATLVLLPVTIELLQGKASMFSNENYTNYYAFNDHSLKSIYKLTPGSFAKEDISYGSPNLYTSLYVLVLCMYFFLSKNIKKKEKIVTACFLGFYLLCFAFNFLDYGWQLFQKPIWYPCRYSFTFSLLLILIAHKSLNNINYFKNKLSLLVIFTVSLIFLIIIGAIYSDVFKELSLTANIVFLLLSIFIIVQYIFIFNNKSLIYFASLLFVIEIIANGIFNVRILSNFNTTKDFRSNLIEEKEATNAIKELEADNSFYRMDMKDTVVINSGMVNNYNGINYFSSVRNQHAIDILNDLGYKTIDGCSVRVKYNNPIINTLVSLKYIISNNDEFYYKYLPRNTKSNKKIYKNEDVFGIATLVNENLYNSSLTSGDSITNSRIILSNIINENYASSIIQLTNPSLENVKLDRGIYYLIDNSKSGYVTYNIDSSKSGFYLFRDTTYNCFITAIVNGKEYNLNSYNSSLYVNENDKVKLKIEISSSYSESGTLAYFLSYENYEKYVNILQKNKLNIIEYKKDNYIRGEIIVNDANNILMTSIPYDEGWKILVDGKVTKYDKIFNHLIAIPLASGEHIIEFSYFPRGLKIGLIISGISLMLSIIYLITEKSRN